MAPGSVANIDQCNRPEGPEINPSIYSQLILHYGDHSVEKEQILQQMAEITGCPHILKEGNWSPTSHHMQNQFTRDERSKCKY